MRGVAPAESGDVQARLFEAVCRQWEPLVATVCRAALASCPDTWLAQADLVQEAHIQIYRKLGYILRAQNPTPYLWRLVKHTAHVAIARTERVPTLPYGLDALDGRETEPVGE